MYFRCRMGGCIMSVTVYQYAKMFGNIAERDDEQSMARCACVSCNSCTCACSCRIDSDDSDDVDWGSV
ncbi:FibroRumin family radical SAM-modified Cys-rich RiPP [Fibrobacter succinogenes]|uniref:FibroRumin family radical SAM-modified Cys-rich RiPP n=1 Tax=Fibrobacter succinogenes TaxID=833 RepID=UPI003B832362